MDIPSDGDLYRLTFHKGFDLELFKARVLSKGFIFNGFFKNYVAKEMGYADKAPEAKVKEERQKLEEYKRQLALVETQLEKI